MHGSMSTSEQEEQRISLELFQKIRPICVRLTELTLTNGDVSGSSERLQSLKDLSTALTEFFRARGDGISIALNLADYIFFPISQFLGKNAISDSELEHCLYIVDSIATHCWIKPGHLNTKLFEQLISLVSVLIGGAPNNVDISGHSEEVIQNGVSCIKHLMIGCQNQADGFETAFLQKKIFQSILAHTISVLLECSLKCPKLEAKLDSLRALNVIMDVFEDGESLALILPGIMSVIAKLIKSKPHYLVVVDVLKLMSSIMSITFSDFDLGVVSEQPKSLEDLKRMNKVQKEDEAITEVGDNSYDVDNAYRNEQWLESTLPHLKDAFKIILAENSDWLERQNYREAVLHLDMTILRNCIITCRCIIPLVLKSLAILDSYDDLSEQYLESLTFGPNVSILSTSMKELFGSELRQLSFNLASPDSSRVRASVSSITFAVKILIELKMFDSYSTRQLLSHIHSAMASILVERNSASAKKPLLISSNKASPAEYQSELSIITSDYVTGSISSDSEETSPFIGVFEPSSERAIIKLLEIAASAPQVVSTLEQLLMDYDLTQNSISVVMQKGVLLWMEDVILKSRKSSVPLNSDVEAYMDFSDSEDGLSLTNVQDDVYHLLENATNILEVNSNTIVPGIGWVSSSIIGLRAIGDSCTILGGAFKEELIDVLFPVIECLASANEAVRIAAQHLTLLLARTLYGGSVRNLIKSNSDYLLDLLSLRLTGESLNPRLPVILVVLIKIGGPDLLNQLDDVITAMFTLLDLYYGYTSLCEGFFAVFSVCIDELKKEHFHDSDFLQIESEFQEDNSMYHEPWGMKTLDQVYKYVNTKSDIDDDDDDDTIIEEISSDQLKNGFSGIGKEKSDSKNEHPDIHDEAEKWFSPLDRKTYNLLLDMLEYAERLAKHRSVSLTLITLKLVNKIIPLIATQRSSFLPAAATVWDYVCSFLFDTDDARVITCAIAVLKNITRFANTFMSSRFIKLFNDIDANSSYSQLLLRWKDYQMKLLNKADSNKVVLNRTSTSLNWDQELFNSICDFYQYSLQKLGRFVPNDVATKIVTITVVYDSNESHYGYFDDLVEYIKMDENIL